jgi:hypothetical protein
MPNWGKRLTVTFVTVSGDATTHTLSRTWHALAMLSFYWVPNVVEVLCAESR